MKEIELNDFQLNLSHYESTAVAVEKVDLATTHHQLMGIEQEITSARDKHNALLKELGLPPLP